MSGEKDLEKLLKEMSPKHNVGDYVFCTVPSMDALDLNISDLEMIFKEEEGLTVIVKKELADKISLDYSYVSSWITLMVHSSLEAVGLTAAFSKALTEKEISCNVVSGFYHDHIFVDKKDTEKAMEVLSKFSK